MEQVINSGFQQVLGIALSQLSGGSDGEPWSEDEDVIALTAEWMEMTRCATESPPLPDIHRLLQRFSELDQQRQNAVYLKGARDCVILLRELGVL